MPTRLPNSTTTLYQQPDGTYQITASGVSGETPTTVYVTDLVCTDDLDANGAETTSDLQAFAAIRPEDNMNTRPAMTS